MTQSGQDDPSLPHLGSIPPAHPEDMTVRLPAIELTGEERLTAFYNTHLAHQFSSSYLSKGLIPPKSLPRPNTSLRQLRSLLARIHLLETCRGFVPDRVTANIVLGCWVRCALAPHSDGVRMVMTRDKKWKISPRHRSGNRQFGVDELRKLFGLVSRLFDRAAGMPHDLLIPDSMIDTVFTTTALKISKNSKKKGSRAHEAGVEDHASVDPGLDYARHIKPFVRIFQHGYKHRKDLAGLDALREWDMRIKAVLSERYTRAPGASTGAGEEADLD